MMAAGEVILVIDGALAIMEFMHQRNLNAIELQAALQKMKANGNENFTLDELGAELLELGFRIDNF